MRESDKTGRDEIVWDDGAGLTTLIVLETGDLSVDLDPTPRTAPPVEVVPELGEGSIVGGTHEILREIGRGGFGAVYKARHLGLGRVEALKVLTAGRGPAADAERFLHEAQIVAGLDHPNVVRVFDTGFDRACHRHYIAMELLEGRPLNEEIKALGSLPAERAVALFADCLDGLAQAHAKGVVHKDLKPANLFVVQKRGRERLVVLDFGVARSRGRKLTVGQEMYGTPRYAAPEYIRHGVATPATDVYQMGLILAETVSGRPVLDLAPQACLIHHASGKSLSLPDGIDPPLLTVLARAVEKDPEARFRDAGEMADALRALAPSLREPAAGLAPRVLVAIGACAFLLVVLALVGAAVWVAADEPSPSIQPAPTPTVAPAAATVESGLGPDAGVAPAAPPITITGPVAVPDVGTATDVSQAPVPARSRSTRPTHSRGPRPPPSNNPARRLEIAP